MKSIKPSCRQVVVALKGGGCSGKTSSLRKLYNDLIGAGAVLMDSDGLGTKNLRRYYLAYKRWRVVICEGGDSADIICENFDWANTVTVAERLSCGNKIRDVNHWNWDIIVMPAWTNMYSRDSQDVFPAAGFGYHAGHYDLGEMSCCWSASPCLEDLEYAWWFKSDSFFENPFLYCGGGRYYGQSVRPIREFKEEDSVEEMDRMTHLKLDCRANPRERTAADEGLVYDSGWYDNAVEVRIDDNGNEVVRGSKGVYHWAADDCNAHVFTLTALASDGTQITNEVARFTAHHLSVVTQTAVEPEGLNPGYTAEIKCSRCGATLQERTVVWADGIVMVSAVTAQQRYPWNGLVDVVVTIQGGSNEIGTVECDFAAMNSATLTAVPVADIRQVGVDSVTAWTCTRHYLWNAVTDVGEEKIDDLALTVELNRCGGVQLWENGPYWAECNVGASKPEGYGYYFWWGDIVGYNVYYGGRWCAADGSDNNFVFGQCPTDGKSAAQLQSLGYTDSTGNLVASRDAATAYLGAPWRMPTDADLTALISNCTTTWTRRNGVYGRLVSGRGAFAGKSVFFPAAGYANGGCYDDAGSCGHYRSSTPDTSSSYARGLCLDSGSFCQEARCRGAYGESIRPLRDFVEGTDATSEMSMTIHLKVDCRKGSRDRSAEGEELVYDSSWFDNAALVKIDDNGKDVLTGARGTYSWAPDDCSAHLLTLTALTSDGIQITNETARFSAHSRVVTQPAVAPDGSKPGYTAEIKCSCCGATLQERTTIWAEGVVIVTDVAAQQRYPWNGLVDITVTIQGDVDQITKSTCTFVGVDNTTQKAVPISHISQIGTDSSIGGILTRRFLWDATADAGKIKTDDFELIVDAEILSGGVQLWENGPYWSECNVGASKPEGYGFYFWWGDTLGYTRSGGTWKSDACDSYYSGVTWVSSAGTVAGSSPFDSSVCPIYGKDNFALGYADASGNLISPHDAATTRLGAPWRMPTKAEFYDIDDNCTISWTTCNGVYGRRITGKGAFANKSIFLPAAGSGKQYKLFDPGSQGHYWSSSSDSGKYPWRLDFTAGGFYRTTTTPEYGYSVRPVRGATVGDALTTHFKLDCRDGLREKSDEGEILWYDAAWYENGEVVRITDNGMVVITGTIGSQLWQPVASCSPNHTLKLEVLSEGNVVGTETAQFGGVTPSFNHTVEVSKSAVAPTEKESGWTEEWVCTECGDIVTAAVEIPPFSRSVTVTGSIKIYYFVRDAEKVELKVDGVTMLVATNSGTFVWQPQEFTRLRT